MSLIIHLFALFNTFLLGSSYVVIGNYSQLNSKVCGKSRLSSDMDSTCFEWHKGVSSELRRGKNVTKGDAPWIAYLSWKFSTCSGSLIANQWILTAGHCLKGFEKNYTLADIRIYLGYDFTRQTSFLYGNLYWANMSEIHIHPKYQNIYNPFGKKYDLALIKMESPINTTDHGGMLSVENNICLPQKWSGINEPTLIYEYAMIAGWGGPTGQLKMAYWRLLNYKITDKTNPFESKAILFRLEGMSACSGDSGAPIWQYYLGRAVQIAVYVSGYGHPCEQDNQTIADQNNLTVSSKAIWIDTEIDWIKNVTQLN